MPIRIFAICISTFLSVHLTAQECYSYKKLNDFIFIERIAHIRDHEIVVDSIYADDCSIICSTVYLLYRRTKRIDEPHAIYVSENEVISGQLTKVWEVKIEYSYQTMQVDFSLRGGYLHISSKRSLTHRGIKPNGSLVPYTLDQMTGPKKELNIPVKNLRSLNMEEILKEFNNW